MQNYKQHIAFKLTTLAIVLSLILPFAVKLSHAFNHHEHEVCLGEFQTHLHNSDLDCSFYKFKTSNSFTFTLFQSELVFVQANHRVHESQYEFISNYQKLQHSLRGPPQINLIS